MEEIGEKSDRIGGRIIIAEFSGQAQTCSNIQRRLGPGLRVPERKQEQNRVRAA